MDRKDLKIQALLEKLSQVSTQKENEIADLRVELTIVSEELRELRESQSEEVSEEAPADDED